MNISGPTERKWLWRKSGNTKTKNDLIKILKEEIVKMLTDKMSNRTIITCKVINPLCNLLLSSRFIAFAKNNIKDPIEYE